MYEITGHDISLTTARDHGVLTAYDRARDRVTRPVPVAPSRAVPPVRRRPCLE